ncbi:DUF305 domain-containing protein [Agromyces sp. ISL-38]|uniref:DUF305 domain-containing protein n=1 Tax=Agromyces sp. ISL-38 TaxID=2819107 RepID=UPI001BE69748|nr:DUF305 domain-containing protein [Agromyces sp. ISL-38]MBT2499715.1 DUF305 domain-containing protein [Agromyces sp. ISL-38]MBT2516137.1 DUF305 domain-containing protein [Streptomyces sp. ISL-90]
MSERMPRNALVLGAALAGVLAVALSVSGCTVSTPDDAGAATAFVTPAPPGGGTPSGGEHGDDITPESGTTAADLAFIDAMIAHHEQAVELTALAPGRAADQELADLAGRMHSVQAAEAEAMRSWLDRRRSRDVPDEHDHAETMRGEISRSTLDRAAELDGAAFDDLFIDTMVAHHRGAMEMAEDRLAEQGDPAVARWARAIATAQSLEVDRLLEIEARLDSE